MKSGHKPDRGDDHPGRSTIVSAERSPLLALASVPSLNDLLADPTLLDVQPVSVLLGLRRQLRYLDADLDAAISRRTVQDGQERRKAQPDRLLTAKEAAEIAGVKPSWFIRHGHKLPFTRKLSHKVVRYSEAGLHKWLATRRP